MRREDGAVLCFESSDDGLPRVSFVTIVPDTGPSVKCSTTILRSFPPCIGPLKLSEGDATGREGDYTSENLLRALIVQKHLEGLPFRDAVIRIGSEPFLQDFLRMRKRVVMDFTFLDKCFLVIGRRTWRRVNELLGHYGVAEENGQHQRHRTDTTVVESNIHVSHGCVALWGHLAGGVAAAGPGQGRSSRKVCRIVFTTGRSRAVPLRHPLHAQ